MISEADKRKIREISRKYHASQVLLFGSSLSPSKESHDIDIAVEGIPAKDFFRFYGDLMFALSKPVDVVELTGKLKFVQIIREEGVPLYG
jgi:predicted nucleotidyltransferase